MRHIHIHLVTRDADGAGRPTRFHGLDAVIETEAGAIRQGKGWSVVSPYHYGYFVGIPGADGDSLDVCVNPNGDDDADLVFVVDQGRMDDPDEFDEHKVFIGYPNRNAAAGAYAAGHHKASRVFRAITPMTVPAFKSWIRTADMSQPCKK